MNWLLNKLTGLGSVWDKANGAKTYIGGSIGMLSGAAGLLGEVLKLISDRNALEVWAWLKQLPSDQYVLTFAGGLAAVGLRHALAKQDAASVTAQ